MCIFRYRNKELGYTHPRFGTNKPEIPLSCLYLNDSQRDNSGDVLNMCSQRIYKLVIE